MKNKLLDLILHPARLRILREVSGEALTAGQLAGRLPDIPQASLYRHIKRLAGAGLLAVVEERPVRGTVEKVYTASLQGTLPSAAALRTASKEDLSRLFVGFITSLLQDFDLYLESTDRPDFAADGVGLRQVKLNLSDEELYALAADLNTALLRHAHPPGPGRRTRLFSTVLMPAVRPEPQPDSPDGRVNPPPYSEN